MEEDQVMALKKISIVIEETNSEGHFNVYLAGDIERFSDKTLKDEDYTAAEFWVSNLFAICVDALKKSGAMKKKIPKGHH